MTSAPTLTDTIATADQKVSGTGKAAFCQKNGAPGWISSARDRISASCRFKSASLATLEGIPSRKPSRCWRYFSMAAPHSRSARSASSSSAELNCWYRCRVKYRIVVSREGCPAIGRLVEGVAIWRTRIGLIVGERAWPFVEVRRAALRRAVRVFLDLAGQRAVGAVV